MAAEMIVLSSREEWLKNRTRVGGSEASALVGMNPYCDNVRLWELKTGRAKAEDISDKPYVQYGTQAEMHLRGLFRLDFPQYRVEYVENNMWLNDKYPWGHYSADGWLYDVKDRLGILEIKTTEILRSAQWALWNNRLPNNYYIQLLHGMLITEAEFAVLKAQLKTMYDGIPTLHTRHYFIERSDVEDDIQYLAGKGKNFWRHVQDDTRPALLLPEI